MGIFIEGNFKYICKIHKDTQSNKYFNQEKLNEIGKLKRKIFRMKIRDEVKECFTIGECCIKRNNYPRNFKKSTLFSNEFGKKVLLKLDKYNKNNYIRINYQNCINPAFNIKLCQSFNKEGSTNQANKYDIDSAFLTCLTHDDFKLPKTTIPKIVLVNQDSDTFFKKIDENDNNFGFIKFLCIPNKNDNLQFFPYYSDKFGIQYTFCKKCCDNNNKTLETCKHNEDERGFFVETYLKDALYFRKNSLGKIKVVHIIYFESKHNEELSYLANLLLKFRKEKSFLCKLFSKQIALTSIGRFAFNVDKHCNKKDVILNNYTELMFELESKNIKNLDFYDNVVIARKKKNLSTFDNNLLSARLNCSSLLFGVVNNRIRQELYDIYLKTKIDNFYNILRFDTDALILSFPNKCTNNEVIKYIFRTSKFKYKLEYEDIEKLINLRKKSHFFVHEGKTIVKIPGLSLNVEKRNQIYNNGFI